MEIVEGKATLVKGVAFDLEGTIIDLEPLHHLAHLRAAADVGVNLSWHEAIERLPHFVGGPDEEVAAEIIMLSKNETTVQKILSTKRAYFRALLDNKKDIEPRKGFREFLDWVKSVGVSISIGTVTERDLAIQLLKLANLENEFLPHLIVSKEDVPKPKPSPDVYYETARRMNINPKNQLVFEDSMVGLNSARHAGCRLVAIPTIQLPNFSQLLYRAGAEQVFLSWEDEKLIPFVLQLISANSPRHLTRARSN